MLLRLLFTLLVLLAAGNFLYGQDYIVTWENDTLPCRLVQHPEKDRLKPAAKYKNGYLRLAVLFPNDSLRIYHPGEIKSYYRARHGRGLLCDGIFHAVKAYNQPGILTNAEGQKDGHEWYFMLLEETGIYASLYKIMILNKRLQTFYYVVRHPVAGNPEGYLLLRKKDIITVLAEPGISVPMTRFIRNNKNFRSFVREYNRLKSIATRELDLQGKK
jgi:hypothetical protein